MRNSEIFLRTLIEFQGQAHHLGTDRPVMFTRGHGGIYLECKAPASGSVMAVEVRYAVGSLPWAWWQKVAGISTDPPLCVSIPSLPWSLLSSMNQSTGWLSVCKWYWRVQSRTCGCGRKIRQWDLPWSQNSRRCHMLCILQWEPEEASQLRLKRQPSLFLLTLTLQWLGRMSSLYWFYSQWWLWIFYETHVFLSYGWVGMVFCSIL